MMALAINGLCIGIAESDDRAIQILDNWNNQRPYHVCECQATDKEFLTSAQVFDVIYHGVPLSIWTKEFTNNIIQVAQISIIRSVEHFL